jgi:GNAT superfamily N-acetyltransferase
MAGNPIVSLLSDAAKAALKRRQDLAVKKGVQGIAASVENAGRPGSFNIMLDGQRVGDASVLTHGDYAFIDRIQIDPAAQNKGVGTKVYADIERKTGKTLVPSPLGLSGGATTLWKTRLAGNPRSKEIIEAAKTIGRSYGLRDEHLSDRLDPIAHNADIREARGGRVSSLAVKKR